MGLLQIPLTEQFYGTVFRSSAHKLNFVLVLIREKMWRLSSGLVSHYFEISMYIGLLDQ